MNRQAPLETPDGRDIVVCGRFWRRTRPHLEDDERERLVAELTAARRVVKQALGDAERVREARKAVHDAKVALDERGPVWWTGGAPDMNRPLAKTTPLS